MCFSSRAKRCIFSLFSFWDTANWFLYHTKHTNQIQSFCQIQNIEIDWNGDTRNSYSGFCSWPSYKYFLEEYLLSQQIWLCCLLCSVCSALNNSVIKMNMFIMLLQVLSRTKESTYRNFTTSERRVWIWVLRFDAVSPLLISLTKEGNYDIWQIKILLHVMKN